jgi:hypothetical protein
VPRLYSPEWVDSFNAAVADLDVGAADTGTSLAASEGRFRVDQVVHGAPDGGQLQITLVVADGRLRLALPPAEEGLEPERTNVTVSLAYEDAAALSRGELDAAALIGAGRVRVRGDLSVLIAGQALLVAAGPRLAELQASTTY